MSCNYCWNQPKKYGKYDMYLDGKLTANEVVYKTLSESGEKENVNLDTKIKEIEKRLEVHFTFQTVTELPEVGEETVIYLKSNDETSADPDAIDTYNEYVWVKDKGAYELIGSGTYEKQKADLKAEIDARIKDVDTEEERAKGEEKRIEEKLDQEIKDRIADVNAEEKRAIEVENELSAYIKKEEEIRTNQINGLNQEAKQNRNRIEQLESKVSSEINRATKAENELSEQITTIDEKHDENLNEEIENREKADTLIQETIESITGYQFEKISDENSNINIDNRIKNEITDRIADVDAEEERAVEEEKKLAADIERFGGNVLSFYNNIDKSISLKNFEGQVNLNNYNAGGVDLTIEQTGILESIKFACRINGNQTPEETWVNVWKINENGQYDYLITSDSLIINGEEHGHAHQIKGFIVYTFTNKNIKIVNGDRLRISFHNKTNKDNTETFDIGNTTESCLGVIISTNDDIVFNTLGGTSKHVPQYEIGVWSNINGQVLNEIIKSVNEEKTRAEEEEGNLSKKFEDYTTTTVLETNYSTKSELNDVDKKFEDYVTKSSLQEQITLLNGTITQLEARIAALEPEPEEPENGEVTDPTETGTPTE